MVRIAALLLFVSAFVLSPSAARAQGARGDEQPVIITSGEGEVTRAPDRAFVAVRAESRAKDPKEAQRLNTQAMEAVMAKLKGLALAPDAIKTISYEVHPEFDYANNRQTLRGYVARNTIEVRVDEITKIGDVLGASVGSGATSIGGLRFDLKDREGAEREAIRLAVRDARGRAEAAASGAGLKIDRIVRIEESRMPTPRPMVQMREMAAVGMAAEQAAPPITPGTIEIRAQVTLTAAVR